MMDFGHDLRKRHLIECARQMGRWREGMDGGLDEASDGLVVEVMQGLQYIRRGLLTPALDNVEPASRDKWMETRERCKLEPFPMEQIPKEP